MKTVPALLALAFLCVGCGPINPDSNGKAGAPVQLSFNGGYTGSTSNYSGGGATFTVAGNAVSGTIHLDHNSTATPILADLTMDSAFAANDPFTVPCTFAVTNNYTDGNSYAAQDNITGTIHINSDRSFVITIHLVSYHFTNNGSGIWTSLAYVRDATYLGTHNPGG